MGLADHIYKEIQSLRSEVREFSRNITSALEQQSQRLSALEKWQAAETAVAEERRTSFKRTIGLASAVSSIIGVAIGVVTLLINGGR